MLGTCREGPCSFLAPDVLSFIHGPNRPWHSLMRYCTGSFHLAGCLLFLLGNFQRHSCWQTLCRTWHFFLSSSRFLSPKSNPSLPFFCPSFQLLRSFFFSLPSLECPSVLWFTLSKVPFAKCFPTQSLMTPMSWAGPLWGPVPLALLHPCHHPAMSRCKKALPPPKERDKVCDTQPLSKPPAVLLAWGGLRCHCWRYTALAWLRHFFLVKINLPKRGHSV